MSEYGWRCYLRIEAQMLRRSDSEFGGGCL